MSNRSSQMSFFSSRLAESTTRRCLQRLWQAVGEVFLGDAVERKLYARSRVNTGFLPLHGPSEGLCGDALIYTFQLQAACGWLVFCCTGRAACTVAWFLLLRQSRLWLAKPPVAGRGACGWQSRLWLAWFLLRRQSCLWLV